MSIHTENSEKSEVDILKYLLKVAEEMVANSCPVEIIKKYEVLK